MHGPACSIRASPPSIDSSSSRARSTSRSFVFGQDDWTSKGAAPDPEAGQAAPRDNVVFEAGLFGGAIGMRRTFILHARGAKLPTDLLGMTSIRYDPDTTPVDRPSDRPAAPQGDRRRRPPQPARGSVVAAVAYGANRARTIGRLPAEHHAGPDRSARDQRALLGRGRHVIRALLERGVEGAGGSGRHLLLLQRRASAPPGRPGDRRDRRDQARVGRSRQRVLHDTLGRGQRLPRQDVGHLPARRPRRSGSHRRRRSQRRDRRSSSDASSSGRPP